MECVIVACACLIPIATDIAKKLILARDMTNLFSFIQMEFLMKQEMNEPYMQHYVKTSQYFTDKN